jgi:hypothetical protein
VGRNSDGDGTLVTAQPFSSTHCQRISKLRDCVGLLFWGGQTFEDEGLTNEGSFKAAETRFTAADQVKKRHLKRWLAKARDIQWDYKNIVRRKGRLVRLK